MIFEANSAWAHILDERVGVLDVELLVGAFEWPRLRAARGATTASGRRLLGDAGDRNAERERGCTVHRSRTLGAGQIDNNVDEGLAGLRVVLAQHFGGDLDEVRLELTGVPLGQHVGDLVRGVLPVPRRIRS